MLEFKHHVEVDADADAVWQVIGDFAGWSKWHPWVLGVELEAAPPGIGRRVHIDGGVAGRRTLVERLVHFDLANRELAYTVVGGNPPFQDYVGRLRMVALDAARCRFEFHARFRPAPGKTEAEALERVETFYRTGLDNVPALFRKR